MASGRSFSERSGVAKGKVKEYSSGLLDDSLHPAWLAFIRFCVQLDFGEIERLKIQDGMPFLAELTTKKIKFG